MGSIRINVVFVKLIALSQIFLMLIGCGGGDESGSLPIVLDAPIAYVKRPVQFDQDGDLVPIDITNPIAFHPGGDLFVRSRAAVSGEEKNISSFFTQGMGDVKDVEFNFDGTKVIFAMRAPDIPNAQPEDQPKWDIWEYNIESDTTRRIISDENIAQRHHDVAPTYLPSGEIIFSSSRQTLSQTNLGDEGKEPHAGVIENNGNQFALVLHRMNNNGGNITQISFNQSHDFDPIVLNSGRVLFSRWDNAGNSNAVNLYSVNPDGTDLQLVYGAHSHDTGSDVDTPVQFMKVSEDENGEILSLLTSFSDQSGGGSIVSIDTQTYIDNTEPNEANQGATGPAQTTLVNTNIITDGSPSPGGLYSSAYPLRDGSNRYLVSWTPCRLQAPNSDILPCTSDNLADANNVVAPPLFGLFLYDDSENTQVPITTPVEGIMFTDVAAGTERREPFYIQDKVVGTSDDDLTDLYITENVGVINIESIFNVDGSDLAVGGIPVMSDPDQTAPNARPKYFLRITKAVPIPDGDTIPALGGDIDNDAFGVSTQQGMREIIGYAPVHPDGSVKVKVPANVSIAISIVDETGKRITQLSDGASTPNVVNIGRHQNWIQVKPGETITCKGCHDHGSGSPHGRPDAPDAPYNGITINGVFPNTENPVDASRSAEVGETMAELLARADPGVLNPTVDMIFTDVWTDDDPAGANIPKADAFSILYADLDVSLSRPASATCQTQWQNVNLPYCRTIINYETHIHQLWSLPRGGNTCTNCHTAANIAMTQLDLTTGQDPSTTREKAYEELMAIDIRLDQFGQPVLIQDPDEPFLPDINGDLTIPNMVPEEIGPVFSTGGAVVSGTAFNMFEAGSGDATHEGILSVEELRLLAEWLDIGGQYYNNPLAVDTTRFVN